jgi:putative nucleotidyltransferase with HDIG domain
MINFNLKTQLSWNEIAVRTAFVLVTVAAIVWFMPRPSEFNFTVEEGKPWSEADLTATFAFPVYKSEETMAKERAERMKEFVPRYNFDKSVGAHQVALLRQKLDQLPIDYGTQMKMALASSLNNIYKQDIIESVDSLTKKGIQAVWHVEGITTQKMSVQQLLTPRQAYERLLKDPAVRRYAEVLQELNLHEFIVPNMVYDKVNNQPILDDLLYVYPKSRDVQAGEKIISHGDIVNEDTYQVLKSYRKEYEKRHTSGETALTTLGKVLYVFIIILMFTIFLGYYRKDYFDKLRSASMLYALIVVFMLATSLLVSHSLFHVYIIPFAVVPIFVRVFMDSRTAYMTMATVILIAASMLQHPLEFIAVEMVAGLAVVFAMRELSSRAQLFWTAAIFILVSTATHFSLFLIRVGDLQQFSFTEYTYLVLCGVIVFCAYPLLYVIEKTFGFVSDITLVELSNTNKELLRRMSEVAPGTFNHSIQVGNLAAEVARRIDANTQLVRTGALYHDIGKTVNPIYFTENQAGGISPHEHLSYIESAQYIIGHVTEGLKLADKNHLPRQIREFIATHHGQGKAKYFYIKYKNEHPDEPVDDLLFTYPGPNPFTKEQAILMMADSVEAASRSLPDYSEQSIRTLVERIIDGMVSEGFFRECPITFRDIQYSKTVLIEKLKTIYHTRISYPEARK